MPNVQGRNVRVEVSATFGTPVTVTAVSLANPGVATAASHGQANGTVGFFTVTGGMPQLDGQAVRVAASAAGTFNLQELDTTSFTAYTAGTFTPVATWQVLSESTSYSIGGAGADQLDASRLIDVVRQNEQGMLGAQAITLNTLAQDVPSAAERLIMSAALSNAFLVFRILIGTTAVRWWRGQVSLPSEDLSQGALATGTITTTVKGIALKGAA